MIRFTARIVLYKNEGEKSGWTLIEIPADIAGLLKPGQKKSFNVKGYLDDYRFDMVSLLPVGKGKFVLPLNASVRKQIHKGAGAMLDVQIECDDTPFAIPAWLNECLDDEPEANAYFSQLLPSHQKYFIKWIDSAKTEATRTKRIAQAVTAFTMRMDFGEMIRWNRDRPV